MDLNKSLENLKKYLESEEGQKSIRDYQENLDRKERILTSQLERFHSKYSDINKFSDLIDKIINKYVSISYKDRWYNRGIEPPNELFWFLYNYCIRFGRKCTISEHKKYSNVFTSYLGNIRGYYVRRMDGQGSVIDVFK
jgi:hypothetical protein